MDLYQKDYIADVKHQVSEGNSPHQMSGETYAYLEKLFDFMCHMDPGHKLFKNVDDLYMRLKKDLLAFEKVISKL